MKLSSHLSNRFFNSGLAFLNPKAIFCFTDRFKSLWEDIMTNIYNNNTVNEILELNSSLDTDNKENKSEKTPKIIGRLDLEVKKVEVKTNINQNKDG